MLTATASATDAAILNKTGSGMTTLIISNDVMNDIMKIIRCLEKSGLVMKIVIETIKMKQKTKIRISQHVISLLVNLLKAKGVKVKIPGRGVMRASEGTIKYDEESVIASQYF